MSPSKSCTITVFLEVDSIAWNDGNFLLSLLETKNCTDLAETDTFCYYSVMGKALLMFALNLSFCRSVHYTYHLTFLSSFCVCLSWPLILLRLIILIFSFCSRFFFFLFHVLVFCYIFCSKHFVVFLFHLEIQLFSLWLFVLATYLTCNLIFFLNNFNVMNIHLSLVSPLAMKYLSFKPFLLLKKIIKKKERTNSISLVHIFDQRPFSWTCLLYTGESRRITSAKDKV